HRLDPVDLSASDEAPCGGALPYGCGGASSGHRPAGPLAPNAWHIITNPAGVPRPYGAISFLGLLPLLGSSSSVSDSGLSSDGWFPMAVGASRTAAAGDSRRRGSDEPPSDGDVINSLVMDLASRFHTSRIIQRRRQASSAKWTRDHMDNDALSWSLLPHEVDHVLAAEVLFHHRSEKPPL
ncbi:hypothetical protein EJB05_01547, partial [Eragrostis curvula]